MTSDMLFFLKLEVFMAMNAVARVFHQNVYTHLLTYMASYTERS
jgi:hypothetical protein